MHTYCFQRHNLNSSFNLLKSFSVLLFQHLLMPLVSMFGIILYTALSLFTDFVCESPWYDLCGWLGIIKNQLYIYSFCLCTSGMCSMFCLDHKLRLFIENVANDFFYNIPCLECSFENDVNNFFTQIFTFWSYMCTKKENMTYQHYFLISSAHFHIRLFYWVQYNQFGNWKTLSVCTHFLAIWDHD